MNQAKHKVTKQRPRWVGGRERTSSHLVSGRGAQAWMEPRCGLFEGHLIKRQLR